MQESYKKRIEDEMQLRGLSPDTIECYTDCIKLFMNHFRGKRPSQFNVQDGTKSRLRLLNLAPILPNQAVHKSLS
jgi:hypothetical protein